MRVRPPSVRIYDTQLNDMEQAIVSIRDEFVKLDLIRESSVRLLQESTRLRADITQCEERLKKGVERAIAAVLSMRSGEPAGQGGEGVVGGKEARG